MASDDENDLLAIRAKNMAQIQNMFGEAFVEAKKVAEEVKRDLLDDYVPKPAVRKKRKRSDDTFQFTGYIPTERRKSARLSNTTPRYSYADLDKVEWFGKFGEHEDLKDSDYYFELEDIIREPRTKRKIMTPRSAAPIMRMPEEISEYELSKIAPRSGNKTYSQTGTSCHQCRQKTIDTKTLCRSGICIGVRGQFCGPCLKNRYGEDAREALLDPEWSCPPCRNLCNCSICRTREGKRPTGILAPVVQQEGFSSVKDFLLNLAEKGILKEKKDIETKPVDDVLKTESSDGVLNVLINSYVQRMRQKQIKYEPSKKETNAILGFKNLPVEELKNDTEITGLVGFEKVNKKTCCFSLHDNILYQSF